MKDSRFIELLNLYVDQQLSKEEARELEREITTNPQRAQTYQQYCRMQKACTLLFDQERNQAPNTNLLARSLSEADRKVIAFPDSRPSRWRSGLVYASGLAAAACVAFALMNRNEVTALVRGHHGSDNVATNAPTHSAHGLVVAQVGPTTAKTPVALATSIHRAEYFPVFSTKTTLRDETAGDLVVDNQSENKNAYEWMRTVELTPVSPFSGDQITLASANKTQTITLRGQPSSHPTPTESAAFEFQR